MTKKEVFTKAMEMFEEGSEEREVMAKAIAQLDKKSSKPTKAQRENEGYKVQIADYLSTEPQTAREIAEGVGLSTNKVAALLRTIEGVEKIPGEKSKDAPKYRKMERIIVVDEQEDQKYCKDTPPSQWGQGAKINKGCERHIRAVTEVNRKGDYDQGICKSSP